MFPNFSSLSQREQKRQRLLKQYETDLENERLKREAYSDAIWADDASKDKISVNSKLSADMAKLSIADIYAMMADAKPKKDDDDKKKR